MMDCSPGIAMSLDLALKVVDKTHKKSTQVATKEGEAPDLAAEDGGDRINSFVSNLRRELNVEFGRQWHVLTAKMGEFQCALPMGPGDDYFDFCVAGKLRVIAFRHTSQHEGVLSKVALSPSVWFFFAAMALFVVWYAKRDCVAATCSSDAVPCSAEEAELEVQACLNSANLYFYASAMLMLLCVLSRRTGAIATASKQKNWLKHAEAATTAAVEETKKTK